MAYLTNEFPERISHSVLVCGWSIASILWHDGPFIEAPWCSYSGEVNVIRVYLCLEEGICHVHLAKYFPFSTVSEYVINAGEGEVVSHCIAVKRSIVIYPLRVNSQIWYTSEVFGNTECQ